MVRKLRFAPNLYWGYSLRAGMEAGINTEKADKLKKKLEKKPQFTGLFVLAAAENPENQLEIYSARQLAQSYYKKYPPYIVGIAASYSEAVLLLEEIVQECLQERGDCRLREFLLC